MTQALPSKPLNRLALLVTVFMLALIACAANISCMHGLIQTPCVDGAFSIYPPIGGGEFTVSEALSLTILLMGVGLSLLAYQHERGASQRVAIVFLLLFIATYLGENNLFRDDVRAPTLAVLLFWLSVDLLLARRLMPVAWLAVGCGVAFAGSLGDHTMHIQFQDFASETIQQSPLAQIQTLIGPYEEITEVIGWMFFVMALINTFETRLTSNAPRLFLLATAAALVCATLGDTLLQLHQTHIFTGTRKIGLLFAFLATIAATYAFCLATPARIELPRPASDSHAAFFAVSVLAVLVLGPTMYTHEHNKTVSYVTWLVPMLGLYGYLMRQRGFLNRPNPSPHSAETDF